MPTEKREELPKFNYTTSHGDAILICPNCEYEYIKHSGIKYFNRDGDDGDGSCIGTVGTSVMIERLSANEIPHRRDSIQIQFSCENCPETSMLELENHKGVTIVRWYAEIG